MKVLEDRHLGLRTLQAYFANDPFEVEALLPQAPLVEVIDCPPGLGRVLERWQVSLRRSHRVAIDLTGESSRLWQKLDGRHCRAVIESVRARGPELLINDRAEEARQLCNRCHRRHGGRIWSRAAWERLLSAGDLFLACLDGQPLVAHVVICEAPARARVAVAACSGGGACEALLPGLNRWLHWAEVGHYRALGVRQLDLGGCIRTGVARRLAGGLLPEWSSRACAELFGATLVRQETIRLARSPLLRLLKGRRRKPLPDFSAVLPSVC